MGITMILPASSLIQIRAQGTFDDDGDIVPDNPEQAKQEAEEQQQDYDDRDLPKYDPNTGGYNDDDNNGIDDDSKSNNDDKELPICNDSDLRYQQRDCKSESGQVCEMPDSDDECQSDEPANIRCSNGVLAETQDMCPTKVPYCDKFAIGAAPVGQSCHNRKDYSDTTGLYPCNDGTQKADYKDCKDVSGYNYNNNNDNNNNSRRTPNTIVNNPPRTTPPVKDVKDCRSTGFYDGIMETPFNKIWYAECPYDTVYKTNTYLGGYSDGLKSIQIQHLPITSFDLQSCRYFGEQDAMNGRQLEQILFEQCPNDPVSGGSVYALGYADVVNARNNAMLPKP
jgi:hypothetical protein